MIRIVASTVVRAPRPVVFAFLADRNNHWHLAGRSIEPIEIDEGADGRLSGVVVIRGPFGVRRRARTQVVRMSEPALLGGTAQVGARTRAIVRWDLHEADEGRTRVVLSAAVASATPLDRALLALGGAAWMRRMFAHTLGLLADRVTTVEAPASLQAA